MILPGAFARPKRCRRLIPVFQSDLLSLTWYNKYIPEVEEMQIKTNETLNNVSTGVINNLFKSGNTNMNAGLSRKYDYKTKVINKLIYL